jgi:hypothetical protein
MTIGSNRLQEMVKQRAGLKSKLENMTDSVEFQKVVEEINQLKVAINENYGKINQLEIAFYNLIESIVTDRAHPEVELTNDSLPLLTDMSLQIDKMWDGILVWNCILKQVTPRFEQKKITIFFSTTTCKDVYKRYLEADTLYRQRDNIICLISSEGIDLYILSDTDLPRSVRLTSEHDMAFLRGLNLNSTILLIDSINEQLGKKVDAVYVGPKLMDITIYPGKQVRWDIRL